MLIHQAPAGPVKIYVLAGQSNMEGQGFVTPSDMPGTLEHTVANDAAGEYQFLTDGVGGWKVLEDTWIHYEDKGVLRTGDLREGFGRDRNPTSIGPELGFGHVVGGHQRQQVLIVKAAFGGRSLGVDFRPPSSGWSVDPPVSPGDQGYYYNEILRLVNDATSNLGTYFPDYDATGGYEIAGFGWHQGWNDHTSPTRTAEYTVNLANFIRDIRIELGVPGLPFVVATSGMASGGSTSYSDIELAQLEVGNSATYPEFDGNVAVVDTKSFWNFLWDSPSGDRTHWNNNAKAYIDLGVAFGEAMEGLVPGECPNFLMAEGDAGGVTLSWQNGTETPTSVQVLREGVEIGVAAPGNPPTFLDSTALPGKIDYELVFTMPGGVCDPLVFEFDGAIRDLKALRRPSGVELVWGNAMAYAGIEVRRDGVVIESALPGATTSYIDSSAPSGGIVTYSLVPTDGNADPTIAQVNLGELFTDTFDRADGANLNASDDGKSGLLGILQYTARTFDSVTLDLVDGVLRVDGPAGSGSFGGLVFINDHNFTDTAILGSGGFRIEVDIAAYKTQGSGRQMCVGVGQSLADLNGQAGVAPGDYSSDLLVAYRDATDTLEIYKNGVLIAGETISGGLPNDPTTMRIDYALSSFAAGALASYQVFFDDSATPFTSGLFPWSGTNENYIGLSSNLSEDSAFDNLRISVTTVVLDGDPPVPDPMSWASPPAAIAENRIAMTATTAADPSGVEYFFSNTTIGGHDSGWQDSPTWTDTGLSPSTLYSYTVKARDKSPDQNETGVSTPPQSATTDAADTTAPTPDPMTWSALPAAVSSTAITMAASSASDPSGVEYYFTNVTISDASHDSGWQDSQIWTDVGLSPATNYSYTVRARDKSPGQNETGASTPLSSAMTEASGGSEVLFADIFDRSDALVSSSSGGSGDGDINGDDTGKSGSLGALTWTARAFNGNQFGIQGNTLTQVDGGNGTNGGLAYINDHNFVDASISSGGGFSIQLDIVSYSTAGSGRRWHIGVGQSLAELDALTGSNAMGDLSGNPADLLVAYRETTDTLEIFNNGVLNALETVSGGLPASPTTMRIEYGLSDFNAGSSVGYSVYFDDNETAHASGTFTWDATNQNYISTGNNLSNTSKIDNFEIRGNSVSPPASDYDVWTGNFPGAELSDPAGDQDGDGLTNDEERIWGLDPTNASSVNPISIPLDATGTVSYMRRDPSLSGLTYAVWTSSTLLEGSWVEDTGASQVPGTPDATDVQSVAVTLSPSLLNASELFIRLSVSE